MKTTRILLSIAVAATAALTAGLSHAGTVSETLVQSSAEHQTMVVNYADLNLASAEGREALYWRLRGAARQVCGSSDVRITGDLAQASANRDCYREALAGALDAVPSGQVASVD